MHPGVRSGLADRSVTMPKILKLRSIERELIQIRDKLKKELVKALPDRKKRLTKEIKELNQVIKRIPAICRHYDVL